MSRGVHARPSGAPVSTAHGLGAGALVGGAVGQAAFIYCEREGDTIVCLRQDGSELSIRRPRSRARYGTWRRQRV